MKSILFVLSSPLQVPDVQDHVTGLVTAGFEIYSTAPLDQDRFDHCPWKDLNLCIVDGFHDFASTVIRRTDPKKVWLIDPEDWVNPEIQAAVLFYFEGNPPVRSFEKLRLLLDQKVRIKYDFSAIHKAFEEQITTKGAEIKTELSLLLQG